MTGRALVTGGAGFIGSHLVDPLVEAGWRTVAVDDLSTGSYRNIRHLLDNPKFEFVQGSVLDRDLVGRLVSETDVVYHLAAAVGVQLIVDRPLQSMITNIRGTENLLEAAATRRAKILVCSTSEIYGKNQNGPFKEGKLRWSYSTSKAVDEILAFVYHRELRLPAVVVRLFNTAGPRQSGHYGMVLPRFVGQALRGEALTVYGDGMQSRSFTYVADVIEAMMKLMATSEAEGDVFNVAGHGETTILNLAEMVIEMTGSSSSVSFVPYDEVYGDNFEDMSRRLADTTKLERVTGYRCETGLKEIVASVIEHLQEVQLAG
ncbi:MAG: NAD-dependent epimerase/dehydratase family protein [Chloroflexi bacterium]|nr:MAG: NAD-dependent epimerase/dehydratase family protein [Chloroflexota bacterium]